MSIYRPLMMLVSVDLCLLVRHSSCFNLRHSVGRPDLSHLLRGGFYCRNLGLTRAIILLIPLQPSTKFERWRRICTLVQILFWPTSKVIGLVALPLGAAIGNPAFGLSASGEAETCVVRRKFHGPRENRRITRRRWLSQQ
jgi:hypothetical protein